MSKSLGLIDVLFLVLLILASTASIAQSPDSAGATSVQGGAQQAPAARKLAVSGSFESLARTMSI